MKVLFSSAVKLSLLLPLLCGTVFGQNINNLALAFSVANKAMPDAEANAVAIPSATTFALPALVGSYDPAGVFKPELPSTSDALQQSELRKIARRVVPPNIDRTAAERVVPDFAPPAYARKVAKGQSMFATLRDRMVVFAYGREQALFAPNHIATDSRHRVIVSDPSEPAIHVLDGKDSFRIVGGPSHRLLQPNGIAVDADDNIYIADEKRLLILVYDRDGRFIRSIGDYHGESVFQRPTAIAIDRNAGRLFVLDTPVNQLIVLDLQGRVLCRLGSIHGNSTLRFDNPDELAISEDRFAVLDARDSRVRIFDLDFNLLHEFTIRSSDEPISSESGIALDHAGNVYVSNVGPFSLRVFRPSGAPIGPAALLAEQEHNRNASGLWIDSEDRIFVADTGNSRIRVYQSASASANAR